eukprot:358783-Chlamydomonas_euryale.AAC.2
MHMILEAKRWLQRTFPFWDRRGGRDHVWLMNHDEVGVDVWTCVDASFVSSVLTWVPCFTPNAPHPTLNRARATCPRRCMTPPLCWPTGAGSTRSTKA